MTRMGFQISQQLLDFLQSILLGLAVGICYDLLRPFRLRLPRLIPLLDSSYCILLGGAGFRFLLECTDGEFRGFALLGAVGGAMLHFCAFSDWLQTVWDFWTGSLFALVHILLFPLRQLRRLCKNFAARGKILFYFWSKCYTMIKSMCIFSADKGELRYGKKN